MPSFGQSAITSPVSQYSPLSALPEPASIPAKVSINQTSTQNSGTFIHKQPAELPIENKPLVENFTSQNKEPEKQLSSEEEEDLQVSEPESEVQAQKCKEELERKQNPGKKETTQEQKKEELQESENSDDFSFSGIASSEENQLTNQPEPTPAEPASQPHNSEDEIIHEETGTFSSELDFTNSSSEKELNTPHDKRKGKEPATDTEEDFWKDPNAEPTKKKGFMLKMKQYY